MPRAHVLFVTYLYPPVVGMAPLRMQKFAHAVTDAGHMVTVVSINPSSSHPVYGTTSDAVDDDNGVRVIRTKPGPIYEKRASLATGKKEPSGFKQPSIMGRWLGPDIVVEWLPYVLGELNDIPTIDVLVTHGAPFGNHLIGALVKRRRKISAWVADFGEPWTINPGFRRLGRLRRCLERSLEKWCFKSIDIAVFTTVNAAEAYARKYKVPTATVRSGLVDPILYSHPSPPKKTSARQVSLRIVYTGTFYTIQDTRIIWEALASVDDVELLVAGSISAEDQVAAKEIAPGKVQFLGVKPRAELVEIQRGADVLLLLGAPNGFQIPSKVYEYLYACRPILAVTYNGDLLPQFLSGSQRARIVSNDISDISSAIEHLRNLKRDNQLESMFDLTYPAWLDQDPPQKQFVDVVECLIKK